MNKLPLFVIVFAFALTACSGGVKATVGRDTSSKATQAIVEKWMTAYENRDAQALLSLYSDDVVWSECSGGTCYRIGLSELKNYVPSEMVLGNPGVKVEPQSYFVTGFGYKAVVQSLYSDPSTRRVRSPSVTILEIKNGKIASETWYSAAMP